jgi:predicted Zn-dependent protease
MYNLLISLGVGAALFVVGFLATGGFIAGIFPFLLGFILAYFLLARRAGRKLQAIMERAGKELQAGRIDRGRSVMKEGFAMAKWQFLIEGQIHGQLGALDYMQGRYPQARNNLSKAWARNWMAHAMLAALDLREKKHSEALVRMEKLRSAGGKDPVYWGLYAYIALEGKDRDKALSVLTAALKKLPDSPALQGMANQVRNKKKVKMKPFAPAWYQFFPEQMPRQTLKGGGAMPGAGYRPPVPRA